MITILHELLPLPPELEEDLVVQLVSNLCQSKIRSNEIDDENQHDICLLSDSIKLKRLNTSILCKIIKDLVREPVLISDKTLGKFKFNNKKALQFDYEESVKEEDEMNQRKSRSRLRKNNSN